MPLSVPPSLNAHLAGELTTLATLWEIIRTDGVTYYFTDHDRDIEFAGNLYVTGIGYDRTAIEDKSDMSPDNMDIKGILDTDRISRRDIRAGLFDGAEVWIRIVNYKDPTMGSLIRRRGWLGEVRQNNLGQFDAELRGLAEALSESLGRVFTPGCAVDLGSTGFAKCNRVMDPGERSENELYQVGDEVTVSGFDFVYRCEQGGRTAADSAFDEYAFDVAVNETVSDGGVIWRAREAWFKNATVQAGSDRRTFIVNIDESRLASDPRYYDGGLAVCVTGDNAGLSNEIKTFDLDSAGDGEAVFYLRWPFDVNVGDVFTFYPGCDKTLETCRDRFGNSINFQGFPHVPGDDYLKNYPNPK